MTSQSFRKTDFDEYAGDYDAALTHGLSVSGEDKNYFAEGRIGWLAKCLRESKVHPRSVMDFGCGTGSAVPHLFNLLGVQSIVGIDASAKSLEVAKRSFASEHTQFVLLGQCYPNEQVDLVFCNGVFHHLPLDERSSTVDYVYRTLRPGGMFALWENNPWNPGARYVMSRIPFDRDAIMITPRETRRLLEAGHFEILRTDFLFIFPRLLKLLRVVEPLVSRLPLGAQYQVLARKPYGAGDTSSR